LGASAPGGGAGGGVRRNRGRRRGSGSPAGGVLWPEVGAGLPGLPREQAAGADGQRLTGAPADLRPLCRSLEALRGGAGRPLRASPDRCVRSRLSAEEADIEPSADRVVGPESENSSPPLGRISPLEVTGWAEPAVAVPSRRNRARRRVRRSPGWPV